MLHIKAHSDTSEQTAIESTELYEEGRNLYLTRHGRQTDTSIYKQKKKKYWQTDIAFRSLVWELNYSNQTEQKKESLCCLQKST